jgi:hypothetical protein
MCTQPREQIITITALSEINSSAPLFIVKIITPTGKNYFLEYRIVSKGDSGIGWGYHEKLGSLMLQLIELVYIDHNSHVIIYPAYHITSAFAIP